MRKSSESKSEKSKKRCKKWGVYSGLDTMIREVSNTLPIMNQLHNDKLRDQHLARFEKVKGINFQKATNLRMKAILAKDLHKYGDEITEVVDGAINEILME
jgi:dynein heavy chain